MRRKAKTTKDKITKKQTKNLLNTHQQLGKISNNQKKQDQFLITQLDPYKYECFTTTTCS